MSPVAELAKTDHEERTVKRQRIDGPAESVTPPAAEEEPLTNLQRAAIDDWSFIDEFDFDYNPFGSDGTSSSTTSGL